MIGMHLGNRTQDGERKIHVEPDDPPLALRALNLDGHF
jgi:hypothetical protein